MDETNRNSMKLDIEAVRLSAAEEILPKESYKAIPEVDGLENAPTEAIKNSNMVREKVDHIEDGADEKMLDVTAGGDDKTKLGVQKDEVKFITGDQQNGDAKIDIGIVDKSFSAMTKDELMKFANDPFWVRLRWILFILFWGIWVAMLIFAILIIIQAPKCAAPVPLVWWKQGPFAKINSGLVPLENDVELAKSIGVQGVIYKLPEDETYLVETRDDIQQKIKTLVDAYKAKDINVILDVVPNYVTQEDALFKEALADETKQEAFVFVKHTNEPTTTWFNVYSNGSAWKKIYVKSEETYILSQFGENYIDVQLKNKVAKERFNNVLRKLIGLGVKGIRLENSAHLIIGKIEEEEFAHGKQSDLHRYEAHTHRQTTYQPGLPELLNEFRATVRNASNNEGFLSIADNFERIETLKVLTESPDGDSLTIDLPKYGRFTDLLKTSHPADKLFESLTNTVNAFSTKAWPQWDVDEFESLNQLTPSEYNLFIMALPGVPVSSLKIYNWDTEKAKSYFAVFEKIRKSPSYMHGSFDLYSNSSTIAYTRIKSGNPGYFVILNPTSENITADYKTVANIPPTLTVTTLSNNYKIENVAAKSKVPSDGIPLSPYSAAILTYVPQ
jgi:solute carrier family 3 protein 2